MTWRWTCKDDTPGGNDNWLHILDEEYKEMLAEVWAGNTSAARREMIQCAAVLVNWVETIDARTAAADE